MTESAVLSSIVGFSRMGPNRELKKRVETYWKEYGLIGSDQSKQATAVFEKDIEKLQLQRWTYLKETGLDLVPSGDYSLYDHVLDTAFLFNAIPERYSSLETSPTVRTYFAMARGLQEKGADVPALPMKKWFDTNYHYIVPEISVNQTFSVTTNKPLNDFLLAKSQLHLTTKPVLLGPISFLHLSHIQTKGENQVANPLDLLPSLLPQYIQVVQSLAQAGAKWIQVDEPVFALTLTELERPAYHQWFAKVADGLQQAAGSETHILFTTFFNSIVTSGNLPIVKSLPAGSGIHLDLVRAPEQLNDVLAVLPAKAVISLGLVEGRNVWLTHLQKASDIAVQVVKQLGPQRVIINTSCSLLHKDQNHTKVLSWLSFGIEKIQHVVLITKSVNGVDKEVVSQSIKENTALLQDHSTSPLIHNKQVESRVAKLHADGVQAYYRQNPYTAEVRSNRAGFKAGRISKEQYDKFINEETERCVRVQEEIGIDVLVHGEFERNDMVEFFAEYLLGYLVTVNGWVQSYGSRCVKPAVLYGDCYRNGPMTVDMIKYAQSLTKLPMKGMLTGPTTILKWSFVRNDQPFRDTVFQVALALRDEVEDLDKAGIACIQVDEPAFREGLPLDARLCAEYLKTAVEAFKISTGSVADSTRIHTHMCYSEFEDIFTHIAELDADIMHIECSRSELSLLACFDRFGYPLMVGPGLYDIHSPRVPTHEELKNCLLAMVKYIPASRLWANPDCGLKTRGWSETKAALQVMVDVVKEVRPLIAKQQ
uniref:5-methyltetrahydropteroyltriglutamate--homocysteine S-methyltransferase n=1 Tax=Ditylenchus dipsaci TaxID=166011 RepID=A0A915EDN8_9BILA